MERRDEEHQIGERSPGPEDPTHLVPGTPQLPEPPPAYGYPQQQYPVPMYPVPVVQRKTNGMAIASMVLGILWLYWIGSILALIFGMVAKSQIDSSGGTQDGRGMAIAGIVLGWVGVGILLLFLVFFGGIAGCGAISAS